MSICGVNCNDCKLLKEKKCQGCKKTKGCPFGKKCFIAKYIELGGIKHYEEFKDKLICEINAIKPNEMSSIKELYPLNGSLINIEYQIPNGKKIKFLCDDEIYLGNQVECAFDNEKHFGVVINMNFLLICEYNDNMSNSEIILYKKR